MALPPLLLLAALATMLALHMLLPLLPLPPLLLFPWRATGAVFGTAGVALGSAAPWLIIPVFIGVIVRQVIAGEERKLTAEFGAEYLEYCTRVRRWL